MEVHTLSQRPEESFGQQNGNTAGQDAARWKSGASSQEAASAGQTPTGGTRTARDKYLAIKNAVRAQEEVTPTDEQAEIADRIRRMKSAKEHPQESPYVRRPRTESPARPEQAPERPRRSGTSKKEPSASHSRKKRRKRGLNLFPRKGDSAFEVIRKTVFLLSCTVFMVCLVLIGKYFWENYQNSKFNEEIRREVYQREEEAELQTGDEFRYYSLLPSAEILLQKNNEVVGWIKVPTLDPNSKSPIDYPVLQHIPTQEEILNGQGNGNDYYLDKNLNREYEKAGSIFLDYRNYFDYVVDGQKIYANSQNLIIYGHNMHDYSMFGSLKHYINDATYYDNHPIVELNSNYRKYKYKIFGMIIVDVDDTTETAFDYWNKLNFEDETEFYDYVNEVKRRTVRLTDVDVTYGDQILTLSTCNSTFSQGRLVVFARLLRDGEDLMEGCTSTENPNIKWPNSYYKWHKNTYDPNAEFVPYG